MIFIARDIENLNISTWLRNNTSSIFAVPFERRGKSDQKLTHGEVGEWLKPAVC